MQCFATQQLRSGIAIVLIGLLSLLTACGTGVPGLSRSTVRQAIALQLTLAQAELTQPLHRGEPSPDRAASPLENRVTVKHVQIQTVEPTTIAQTPTYRVTGTYDLTIQQAGVSLTQPSPFEVYLQPQSENESWRLARRQGGTRQHPPTWGTYLIPND